MFPFGFRLSCLPEMGHETGAQLACFGIKSKPCARLPEWRTAWARAESLDACRHRQRLELGHLAVEVVQRGGVQRHDVQLALRYRDHGAPASLDVVAAHVAARPQDSPHSINVAATRRGAAAALNAGGNAVFPSFGIPTRPPAARLNLVLSDAKSLRTERVRSRTWSGRVTLRSSALKSVGGCFRVQFDALAHVLFLETLSQITSNPPAFGHSSRPSAAAIG
jgi:hypothetical protein